MKILLTLNTFNNYGGIINWAEELICGFRDLGHEVNFTLVKPSKNYPKPVDTKTIPEGYVIGNGSKVPIHQGKGWLSSYYSILNDKSVSEYVTFANGHDLIIQGSIFGYLNKETEFDLTWLPMITGVKSKQVCVIHDGNLKTAYPWILKIKDHFCGIACVHPAALNSADFIDIPRNIILNPFDISRVTKDTTPFSSRSNSLLSPQTFKSWKHVDSLVGAVPYINGGVVVAGDGIERNYMTSPDKCKEHYFATVAVDPDVSVDRKDKKIWDNAINSGMEYLGFITGGKRDEFLRKFKFLIDSSWSMRYGEHFNRTVIESMIQGAIPIAVNYGVSDNEEGIGVMLKPGVNYLLLKKDMTPKQYGDCVNEYFNISDSDAHKIRENNYILIGQFDRVKIAQQYIDLSEGKDSGFLPKNLIGKYDKALTEKANKIWETHIIKEEKPSLDEFF